MEDQAGSGYVFNQEAIDKLKALVQRLPQANFRTCAYIMHHLKRLKPWAIVIMSAIGLSYS